MNITLPDHVMAGLTKLAQDNGVTPEEYVVALITRAYQDSLPDSEGINLGKMDRGIGSTTYTRGIETREKLKISHYDDHEEPVLVTVPNDLQLTFPLFKGLFEESIVKLGPNKFGELYVFDANVENLKMISRCARMIWNRVMDQSAYRITMGFTSAGDTDFTLWKQIRDDKLVIDDEVDVGNYYSVGEAIEAVQEYNGILIGDIR